MNDALEQLLGIEIESYKPEVDKLIHDNMHTFGAASGLRDACQYALESGGKRFRPALVFLIADALKHGKDVSQAALAVEYFHTASLIADDLPCMDNDDFRRDRPSTHKVFGEATALLATYSLIAAGYQCIAKNCADGAQCKIAIEIASRCTGIFGASGGQYLDLTPEKPTLQRFQEIFDKKTGTLFELSFAFGWIFGGGSLNKLPILFQAARHFGMAFQLADDIQDFDQDQGRLQPNFACLCGIEAAEAKMREETHHFQQLMRMLVGESNS